MLKRKTQTKAEKEPNFIIVDFLDIDTDKITFNTPKPNGYGGSYVSLRYDGKLLYVLYDARVCPFGLSTNTVDVSKTKERGRYPKDEKVTGYGTSISLQSDDPYYEKAREIDEFLIGKCIENSVLWCLGGSKTTKVNPSSIAGYDDKGDKGKWKRILKYSYKVDKTTKERIYQDYPPRMDFGLPTSCVEDIEGSDGLLHASATFKSRFFDASGVLIPCGFCYHIKCFDERIYPSKTVHYRMKSEGEDVAQIFVDMLEKDIFTIHQDFNFSKPIIMTDADKADFKNATTCWICSQP